MSEATTYCPECGAGRNADGSFRLPRGWPTNKPCATCQQVIRDSFRKLGRDPAEAWEKHVIRKVFGDDTYDNSRGT